MGSRKKLFKPAQFGQSTESTGPNTFRVGAGITTSTKGNDSTITVDIEYLRSTVAHLYEIRDKRIDHLEGEDKSAFEIIYNISLVLHDSKSYKTLRDIVDKRFRKVDSGEVMTVAWYMLGYRSNVEGLPASCNIYNAGTLPPYDKKIDLQCEHSVILAEFKNGSYNITILSHNDNSDTAYLFVNSHDINSYQGFSDEEKNVLKNPKGLGIKNIILHGYSSKHGDIKLLLNRTIPVDDLKCRNHNESHNTNNTTAIIVGVIILIILIIIIAWAANSSRRY